MGWLAVAENQHYSLLAESNRVNLTMVPPRRGWIIDRHGAPIADNRTDFRVDIIPDRLQNKGQVLTLLRNLLELPPEDMARIVAELEHAAGYRPIQVAENLDWRKFAAVSVRLPELPGVAPTRGYARNYPAGAAVAHLTGYVGAASTEQYQKTQGPVAAHPGVQAGQGRAGEDARRAPARHRRAPSGSRSPPAAGWSRNSRPAPTCPASRRA